MIFSIPVEIYVFSYPRMSSMSGHPNYVCSGCISVEVTNYNICSGNYLSLFG